MDGKSAIILVTGILFLVFLIAGPTHSDENVDPYTGMPLGKPKPMPKKKRVEEPWVDPYTGMPLGTATPKRGKNYVEPWVDPITGVEVPPRGGDHEPSDEGVVDPYTGMGGSKRRRR